MRIELNLASRPTENRRRFYVLTGTGVVLLTLLAVMQASAYWHNWGSGRDVGARTAQMRSELDRLETEQKRLEQGLAQPQAREVLEMSYFLNSLIFQKSISWTQIFMDLENLMPNQVQILSIRPQVLENNQVRLEMQIAGQSTDQLLEFLRRVEKSDKFGTPVLSQENPPVAGAPDNAARLTLTVLYAQK